MIFLLSRRERSQTNGWCVCCVNLGATYVIHTHSIGMCWRNVLVKGGGRHEKATLSSWKDWVAYRLRERRWDAVPALRSTWRAPVTRPPQRTVPFPQVCVVYAGYILSFFFLSPSGSATFSVTWTNVGEKKSLRPRTTGPKQDNPLSCCLWPKMDIVKGFVFPS